MCSVLMGIILLIAVNKDLISNFLNTYVRLVKDDGFIIWGRVESVSKEGILFYTDGKSIYLNFDRILEIAPTRRKHDFH